MTRDIKQTWFFSHPPENVWEYLTNPQLIAQWLMKNDFKPVKGHKFNFKTRAMPAFGFDGNIFCEVLEVEPYKRLSYSWKGGANGEIKLDTVVVWTLEAKNGGTELILEHKGFKGLRNFLPYFFMNKGWESKIKKRITELLDKVRK